MSSGINKMGLGEKISLIVSILSLIVASVVLTLSESLSNLHSKAEVVAYEDTIKLKSLINENGYINIINLVNRGTSASKNIKVIMNFKSSVPKYEVASDEDIGQIEVKGSALKIPLDRLSSGSNLKILMYSSSPIAYDMYYVDDSGKNEILSSSELKQPNLLDVFLLLVIIISLLAIVWIYRRVSESTLLNSLDAHQNEIQEKLREVRDEIGNIEIVVHEPNHGSSSTPGDDEKGISQRLADFMTKI